MDIKLAKAVVTEVWRWVQCSGGKWLEPGAVLFTRPYSSDELIREVNSWDGFGRTVDAMEERGRSPGGSVRKNCATSQEMIRQTHKAALDAVRQK